MAIPIAPSNKATLHLKICYYDKSQTAYLLGDAAAFAGGQAHADSETSIAGSEVARLRFELASENRERTNRS